MALIVLRWVLQESAYNNYIMGKDVIGKIIVKLLRLKAKKDS